jgi:cell division initiation protein
VTQQQDQTFPYYRSPDAIRTEAFSHRVRGLDEAEVREYLDLLADQVHSADLERAEYRAENQRLRAEVESLRTRQEPTPDDINPQAVILFSQAQQVADQLVEEAVIHARDLMTSARNQQREILEQAHKAAEEAARRAATATGQGMVTSVTAAPSSYDHPVPEIEYVRTFARVAQVQLRSVLDALTEQVDRLGAVPDLAPHDSSPIGDQLSGRVITPASWRAEPRPPRADEDS